MTTEAKPNPPTKLGRPSSYSTELAYEIAQRLAEGESLRGICRSDDMPDKATVMRWLHAHAEFRQIYNLGRELGMDALCDDALHDATAPMRPEDVQAERLKLDARKWFASKAAPRRWGDRITTEVSGPDGGPVQIAPAMPMIAPEVKAAVKTLLLEAEVAAGLVPDENIDDATRLRRIVNSNTPLHPDLYEIIHQDVKG